MALHGQGVKMLIVLGVITVLVFLLLCGGSAIDKPRTDDQRLNLSIGIITITIVIALVVGLVLH